MSCTESKNKSNAAISNICKPAVERWRHQYQRASEDVQRTKVLFERAKKSNDSVLIGNADNDLKEAKKAKDALILFKKDLGSFTRFYEFMSQIVDYDDRDLEKLSLYARHLLPMLREDFNLDDEIDLSNIEMTHYRVSKLKQQDLKLQEHSEDNQLEPASGLGTATPKDKKEDYLSEIIRQLNDIFAGEGFTEDDMVNFQKTIWDKINENEIVVKQFENNNTDQIMLGTYPTAAEDALFDAEASFRGMTNHLLSNPDKFNSFLRLMLSTNLRS